MKHLFWDNKKVLVTGSEGFIGSHLVERLLELGADVRAFVLYNSFNNWGWLDTFEERKKEKLKIFTGDIRDANNVRMAMKDIDIVFHLAALIGIPYSYCAPESYVLTNTIGTLNLAQAAKDFKIEKIIHTSTSEVYGTALYVPIDEKHPLQAQSPYSASKISADMIADSFYRSFELPVCICRPFNTYGPRQSARAVIPNIIAQILAGAEKIRLGSLDPVRDFTYVKDTVEGFIKIAETKNTIGEVINIGSGYGLTIGELAEKISIIMGKKIDVVCDEERIRPSGSEVMQLVCSNEKAKKMLGWEPKYSLEKGLKETGEFIERNLCFYKTKIYNI